MKIKIKKKYIEEIDGNITYFVNNAVRKELDILKRAAIKKQGKKTPQLNLKTKYRTIINKIKLNDGEPLNYTIDEFVKYWMADDTFMQLFTMYRDSGFKRMLAPGIFKIDSSKGFDLENLTCMTMSDGTSSRVKNDGYLIYWYRGKVCKGKFTTQKEASIASGVSETLVSKSIKTGGIYHGSKFMKMK